MGEYQYYEFQAIDRPLTPEEQRVVASLSSRVESHPRQAVFTYSFGGGLRRRAGDLLAEYYDAMLYLASWGTKQLMFRFPRELIDLEQVQPYCLEDFDWVKLSFSAKGEYVLLDICFDEEEGGFWVEGEGILASLLPLREEILQGDYRALYLAWLGAIAAEGVFMEDELDVTREPPVPPGLGNLTLAQGSFAGLFEIDEHLVQVAAQASHERAQASEGELVQAIAQLPCEECDAFLLRLAQGEPHLSVEFNKRLRAFIGEPEREPPPWRTARELLRAAELMWEQEQKRLAVKAEAKRIQELEALASREEQTWQEVDALIRQKTGKAYDEAVRLLSKLEELAVYQGQQETFQARLDNIYIRYANRPALLRRLREAELYRHGV